MNIEKKQTIKTALKKVGKAIWSALPWVLMWIGLTCFFSLLFISADKSGERSKQLAALEAELALPDVASDYKKASELARTADEKRQALEGLYRKWEEAQAHLEELEET